MAASYAPGAVVTDVARCHDVHPNLLHHWRRQAKRAAEAGGGLKLLPVTVTAAGDRPAASGSIEIELGGAVRVLVDAAAETRRTWVSVASLLSALGENCSLHQTRFTISLCSIHWLERNGLESGRLFRVPEQHRTHRGQPALGVGAVGE